MDNLDAARGQMALSLAFHILFAVAGMAMPLLMVVAEWLHGRTQKAEYRELARRWAKGTAILFAVGAVSGTVLSFELGLLWPTFMEHAGPLIGMPFSMEGFAFFLEAIFLGLYLYGWDRLSHRAHLACGVMVAVSGLASGVFVMAVNSWMNAPAGFSVVGGEIVEIHVWQAMFNDAFPTQATHMVLAAYASVAFAAMGIHGWALRRSPQSSFHRAAFGIAFGLALVTTPLQILSGDRAAKHIAVEQPAKLAAAEALFETQRRAPLSVGGWPDMKAERLIGAIEIPGGLSFLAHGDFDAEVTGLDRIPRDEWPPLAIVHLAFQIMVACGSAMLAYLAWGVLMLWRRRGLGQPSWFLRAAPWAGPLGLVALEAGWVVTEVGRQPWIIRDFMLVKDAVTPMPNLVVPFAAITALYLFLGIVVIQMLRRHVLGTTKRDPSP